LVRAGGHAIALPLRWVGETLRPLPLETPTGAPARGPGVAVIRGAPVPVYDLSGLLGTNGDHPPARWVTLKAGARRFALAVEEVVGLLHPGAATDRELPSALERVVAERVAALGPEASRLRATLRAARVVAPGLEAALRSEGALR